MEGKRHDVSEKWKQQFSPRVINGVDGVDGSTKIDSARSIPPSLFIKFV